MATLCLLDQDGVTAQRWEIGDEPLAVGRDASADVPIEDDALSRRHFIISRAGQGYVVKDLDSQNGTWVDGQQAGTVKLRHHDCILAGRTLFLFSEHCIPAPAVVPPKPPSGLHETAVLPAAV